MIRDTETDRQTETHISEWEKNRQTEIQLNRHHEIKTLLVQTGP